MVVRWSFDRYLRLKHTLLKRMHLHMAKMRHGECGPARVLTLPWMFGKWMHQDCFGSSQMLALKQARDLLASSPRSKHVDVVTSHTALRAC